MIPAGLGIVLGITAAALAGSWALTGAVLAWLRRRAILDHPNDRSSHSVPTPRGGGWGVMLTLVPAWAGIGWMAGELARLLPILAGMLLLVVVSWVDDRRGLSAGIRFLAQIAAVAIGLTALPEDALVFQGLLPEALDRPAAAFCWLWFVNLFNFMDGIDGIAGTEAACIAVGLIVVGGLAGLPAVLAWQSAALLGAALGFLAWNWQPARVFMGDVGSVPLGFALGWLLVTVAAAGFWPAALLPPLYFITDATITLLRRLLAGKRIWQAHREHFYQKSVQRGRSHASVVLAVLVTNLALIALAAASVSLGWWMVPAGVAAVGMLLRHLLQPAGGTSLDASGPGASNSGASSPLETR